MKTPTQQWTSFLARFEPRVAALARAARGRMRKLTPGAIEMVYDNYNGLVIGYCPTERPSEAIFSLAICPDHVSLCFLQGARLPGDADPEKRLKGSGNVARHIRLVSAADLDQPAVRTLIRAALDHAEVGLDPKVKHRLIIKSISAKQRPRR